MRSKKKKSITFWSDAGDDILIYNSKGRIIDKVQVYNNTELVIAQYNKQWWHLPFAQMWKLKMGLNNFRLFLLIAAKILGGCKYQFNKEELKKLRNILFF